MGEDQAGVTQGQSMPGSSVSPPEFVIPPVSINVFRVLTSPGLKEEKAYYM